LVSSRSNALTCHGSGGCGCRSPFIRGAWKPTIDSLGSILGRDEGAREWNARDGRITDLGLHGVFDEAAGSDVLIAIPASSIGEQRPA
jgi:hypothetical protein